ncbi:MAG: hypothetical protein ACFFAZ_05825 [Promethearchaeota archaeon]
MISDEDTFFIEEEKQTSLRYCFGPITYSVIRKERQESDYDLAASKENRTLIACTIMGLKPMEPDHRPCRRPRLSQKAPWT